MKVRLELLGILKLPPGGRFLEKEFRKGVSVGHILKRALRYKPEELKTLQVLKACEALPLDRKITDDATLQVILRLGGG